IRDMMQSASQREDFERARDLRDTLRWLDQVERPVAVEVIGSGDADAIGYARDGEDAAIALVRVRDGRVVGREHRFLECGPDDSDAEILGTWLLAAYRHLTDRVPRLVLPFAPADAELVGSILAGSTLNIPVRGLAMRWLELADQNA